MRLSFRRRLFYLFLLLFVLVGSLAGLILERTLSRRIELRSVINSGASPALRAQRSARRAQAMTPWSSTRSSIRSPKKPALCWRS